MIRDRSRWPWIRGEAGWCGAREKLTQLHQLIAGLQQSHPHQVDACCGAERPTLFIVLTDTPSPHHKLKLWAASPQPLAEVTNLGQPSGREGSDTDEPRALLLYQGHHFGGETCAANHLHRVAAGIEQVLQHHKRQLIRLVTSGTGDDTYGRQWDGDGCIRQGRP